MTLPPPPDPAADPDRWGDRHPDPVPPTGADPVGVAAVACGFVGILFFGLLFALLAAVLGATAGQRARESGRSFEQAYLACGLAVVDGITWIALHLLFDMPVALG